MNADSVAKRTRCVDFADPGIDVKRQFWAQHLLQVRKEKQVAMENFVVLQLWFSSCKIVFFAVYSRWPH